MKTYAISVPGSIITKQTAPGYLRRMCRAFMVDRDITLESSCFLSDIEQRIADAGFMTWDEIEAVECSI